MFQMHMYSFTLLTYVPYIILTWAAEVMHYFSVRLYIRLQEDDTKYRFEYGSKR